MTEQGRRIPQFYMTAPSPCPYLPEREERKLFTVLAGEDAQLLNNSLTKGGFRRSQNIAYQPNCKGCEACVSVRLPVDDFKISRNLRRVWKQNRDLSGRLCPPGPTSEQYSLFRDYLDSRHADGGMADMNVFDYMAMVGDTGIETCIFEYRPRLALDAAEEIVRPPLLAAALTDILDDGLSMVYSFYVNDQPGRSLGTFMILDHIERARKMGLPFVYLGYFVEGSPKMHYKSRFSPQERLGPEGWERI